MMKYQLGMVDKTVTDSNNHMREVRVHSIEKKNTGKISNVGMNAEKFINIKTMLGECNRNGGYLMAFATN